MNFPAAPDTGDSDTRFLVVCDQQLLCTAAGVLCFAKSEDLLLFGPKEQLDPVFIGHHQGRPHWLITVAAAAAVNEYQWLGLRTQLGLIDDQSFGLAGQALQLARWRRDHRYCGRCGGPTRDLPGGERATLCPVCELYFYPRLAPCMITLITRDDYCLLARHARSTQPVHTALAGFVELGERIEDTVHREVKEEVGLELAELRYFGSQAWPFPGQLMLGFHARYRAGSIRVDGTEIVSADWWRYDSLPVIPPAETLSGQLIAHFVAEQHNNKR